MVAASIPGDLLIGLIVGSFLGFLVSPLIRAWLSWREWVSASREADSGPTRDADVFADLVNGIDVDALPVPRDFEVRDASVPGRRRDVS